MTVRRASPRASKAGEGWVCFAVIRRTGEEGPAAVVLKIALGSMEHCKRLYDQCTGIEMPWPSSARLYIANSEDYNGLVFTLGLEKEPVEEVVAAERARVLAELPDANFWSA